MNAHVPDLDMIEYKGRKAIDLAQLVAFLRAAEGYEDLADGLEYLLTLQWNGKDWVRG
jgi:hypothetical protein